MFDMILGGVEEVSNQVSDAYTSLDGIAREASDSFGPISTNVSKNKFGCLVEENVYSYPHTEKTIKAPLVPFHMDYAQQETFLGDALTHHKLKSANGPSPTWTCDDRAPEESPSDFGMLLPVFAAQVDAANPKATYKGRCFEEITFEYVKTS